MASPKPHPHGVADEETRLRDAYRRRGPVEARLVHNAGQAAIVAERDAAVLAFLRTCRRPINDLLDLGCGEGHVLGALAKELDLRRAVGVDILPERLERARAMSPALEFRIADATSLPFDDQTFDAVIAMTVFSSIPSSVRERVAQEIARVVRPEGAFVWYDMRRRSPRNADVRPFGHRDVGRLFPGWTVGSRSVTVVPPLARQLGPITDWAYPLLARVPALRTHEAGSATRPTGVSRA